MLSGALGHLEAAGAVTESGAARPALVIHLVVVEDSGALGHLEAVGAVMGAAAACQAPVIRRAAVVDSGALNHLEAVVEVMGAAASLGAGKAAAAADTGDRARVIVKSSQIRRTSLFLP